MAILPPLPGMLLYLPSQSKSCQPSLSSATELPWEGNAGERHPFSRPHTPRDRPSDPLGPLTWFQPDGLGGAAFPIFLKLKFLLRGG